MSEVEVKRKVPLGRYRDLPLPESWFSILKSLQPLALRLNAPVAPDLWGPIELALQSLDERQQHILKLRLSLEDGTFWTLEATGEPYDLTRERVRQIFNQALKRSFLQRTLRDVLLNEIDDLQEGGVWIFRVAGGDRAIWPYQAFAELFKFHLHHLTTGCWALAKANLDKNPLHRQLAKEPRFYALEEAEKISGLNSYELIHLSGILEGVYLTKNSRLASEKWVMPDYIEAIALALSEVGVEEWHFSQMAKVLAHLSPENYASIKGRDVAAVLSRPNSRFQNVGTKGFWRLKSLGDGFADTKEAVVKILSAFGKPLHHREILSHLDRPVRPETLVALLSREKIFRSVGNGFFALSEHSSVTPSQPSALSPSLLPRQHIKIPRVTVTLKEHAYHFKPFRLDLTAFHYQSDAKELWLKQENSFRKALKTNVSEQEPKLENYLLRSLVECKGVSYDVHIALLHDLSSQLVGHLQSLLSTTVVDYLLRFYGHDLALEIYKQMQAQSEGIKTSFDVSLKDGFEQLKPNTVTKKRRIHEFHTFFHNKHRVEWYAFTKFERCLYDLQIFSSYTEYMLATLLEREAVAWFRPVKNQFRIFPFVDSEQRYQPTFMADMKDAYYFIEVVSNEELNSANVLLKKHAGLEWCHHASTLAEAGKVWKYLLVPYSSVTETGSFNSLVDFPKGARDNFEESVMS